jgi:hypothetical protein
MDKTFFLGQHQQMEPGLAPVSDIGTRLRMSVCRSLGVCLPCEKWGFVSSLRIGHAEPVTGLPTGAPA